MLTYVSTGPKFELALPLHAIKSMITSAAVQRHVIVGSYQRCVGRLDLRYGTKFDRSLLLKVSTWMRRALWVTYVPQVVRPGVGRGDRASEHPSVEV